MRKYCFTSFPLTLCKQRLCNGQVDSHSTFCRSSKPSVMWYLDLHKDCIVELYYMDVNMLICNADVLVNFRSWEQTMSLCTISCLLLTFSCRDVDFTLHGQCLRSFTLKSDITKLSIKIPILDPFPF